MAEGTVDTLFNLDPLGKVYTNAKAKPIVASCASLLYGVELEIEGAAYYKEWMVPGITAKADNSLRNDGMEFVTYPMTISVLNYVLENFFEKAKLTDSNYSERCSVHVHANCRDLTADQVATVAMLYQVFEYLFYKFVGAERDKNIFCVPWYETTLTYNVVQNLNKVNHGTLKRWLKYTGLNLLPLYSFGTVEFRQMAGTHDLKKIIDWCQLIGCLFEYARTHKLEDVKNTLVDLNTTSAYKNSLETVFQQWAELLRSQNYELLLEDGVLGMKYSILNEVEVPNAKSLVQEAYASIFDSATPPARPQLRPRPLRVDAPPGGFGFPPVPPNAAQGAQAPEPPVNWIVRRDV